MSTPGRIYILKQEDVYDGHVIRFLVRNGFRPVQIATFVPESLHPGDYLCDDIWNTRTHPGHKTKTRRVVIEFSIKQLAKDGMFETVYSGTCNYTNAYIEKTDGTLAIDLDELEKHMPTDPVSPSTIPFATVLKE